MMLSGMIRVISAKLLKCEKYLHHLAPQFGEYIPPAAPLSVSMNIPLHVPTSSGKILS